jgi:hypothetical protein
LVLSFFLKAAGAKVSINKDYCILRVVYQSTGILESNRLSSPIKAWQIDIEINNAMASLMVEPDNMPTAAVVSITGSSTHLITSFWPNQELHPIGQNLDRLIFQLDVHPPTDQTYGQVDKDFGQNQTNHGQHNKQVVF